MESRFEPKGPLLDLFPVKYLQILLPAFTRYEALDANQVKKSWNLLTDLSSLSYGWCTFGCGKAYQFPTLKSLTYTGSHRSIFTDEGTECLVLFTTYNKNKNSQPLTKRWDATTSKYLLYYILILLQIQVNLLGPEYSVMSPKYWPEFQGSAIEFSQLYCTSTCFSEPGWKPTATRKI